MAATDVELTTDQHVTTVDPAEVPSAAFGWSGESRTTFRVAAVVVIIALLGIPQRRSIGATLRHLQRLHLDHGPLSRE